MFERFSDRARKVVVLAQEEARLLQHNYIGTEHILLGLIHEEEGVGAQALISLGVSLERARQEVEGLVAAGTEAPHGHIPFTPRAKKVLELALREAMQLGHNYIGTEHILLGLVREGEGAAARVLVAAGAELATVRQEVIRLLEERGGVDAPGIEEVEWELGVSEPAAAEAAARRLNPRAVTGAHKKPICPRCGGSLARTARIAVLDVPDASGATREVRFVFCSSCGETLVASDS